MLSFPTLLSMIDVVMKNDLMFDTIATPQYQDVAVLTHVL